MINIPNRENSDSVDSDFHYSLYINKQEHWLLLGWLYNWFSGFNYLTLINIYSLFL